MLTPERETQIRDLVDDEHRDACQMTDATTDLLDELDRLRLAVRAASMQLYTVAARVASGERPDGAVRGVADDLRALSDR